MDVLTPTQRSHCMARNRGRDTDPELVLRHALWSRGLRYRLNCKIAGKPDLVFPRHRVALFVDGCFWHGCPEHGATPKTNVEFWSAKLARNRERDCEVATQLASENWTVVRVWEHEVRSDLERVVDYLTVRIRSAVAGRTECPEIL